VGASAPGPAFGWVHYILGACGDSCAVPHILISPAFHKSPSLGVTPVDFRDELLSAKSRIFGLSAGEEITSLV